MSVEYRICWSASSNATFHGHSDWTSWYEITGNEDVPADEIERTLNEECSGSPTGLIPDALAEAIEVSGFEWYVETREMQS